MRYPNQWKRLALALLCCTAGLASAQPSGTPLALSGPNVPAAPQDGPELSLTQLIQAVLDHNPGLQAARRLREQAEAGVSTAGALANPRLELSRGDNEARVASATPGPVRGWALRTETNPFGAQSYLWNMTGNAWYARHFWEHYAYTQDIGFLRHVAWPLMQEVSDFWEDRLVSTPDGRLVAPNGWSPEHGPIQDGVAYDQQILWDLFDNMAQAATVLGDSAARERAVSLRDRLAPPRIGSWGQLLEWLEELKDPVLDTPRDTHRHVSHLFGLFPGRQISTIPRAPALSGA